MQINSKLLEKYYPVSYTHLDVYKRQVVPVVALEQLRAVEVEHVSLDGIGHPADVPDDLIGKIRVQVLSLIHI